VDRKADATEIRKKYHKLALETHPDKTGKPEDADQFIKINKAAEVLLDGIIMTNVFYQV
jgi:DnaJ-class molecular chaperone